MYIIFDTETTGLPKRWDAPFSDTDNWPRVVQIAWQLHDANGTLVEHKDFLIRPDGFDIPYDAETIHGISTQLAQEQGVPLQEAMTLFNEALGKATFVVGQNIKFDINVVGCEFVRLAETTPMHDMQVLDTCTEVTANLCKIPGGRGGRFKLPNLTELHEFLFGEPFAEAHNATADVEATTRCFFELIRTESFTKDQLGQGGAYIADFKQFNPMPIGRYGIKHLNLKEESKRIKKTDAVETTFVDKDAARKRLAKAPFVHLHNHTQFTILQSTISVGHLVHQAVELDMKAVALTDTGNMMAAFQFEKAASSHNKKVREAKRLAEEQGEVYTGKQELMPIIGCEFNVCRDMHDKSIKDNGYQIVLLAKNRKGYDNIIKLASKAYTEGQYYVPRIDKKLIEQFHEEVICLTGNLYGEVPNMVLNLGEKQAEEALLYWKNLFKDDLYIEIMRHGQEDEDRVNQTLIKFAKEHEVKLVATNNTFYIAKKDAESHDVLLCVKDNELVQTPIGRGRGFRYGLENQEYYFKTQDEMKELFLDLPEAIENISEIIGKIEHYGLAREVLLPAFDIPEEFQNELDLTDGGKRGENNYLKHLTYVGAEKRYGEITPEIKERLDFELATIERTGYPGYFLIVQDFCQASRDMGVSVGPGRGSAAGSAVAYCTGITNVDPIKYDLLFERFLNPDRISMPDIDIDFDDEGRGDVINWVINKYGSNQVAQIITYGTMAAKSSIKDTARVLDLPLPDADRIAKLIPDMSLSKIFSLPDDALAEKLKNNQDDIGRVNELKRLSQGHDLQSQVIRQARSLEGSIRNTGIHACGVIITPEDITNFVPVATAKDSEMYCTQFDNSVAEEAGLLKMDFLGLKTLTLIKVACRNVKNRHGIDLDPDNFPIDDQKTYELFQRGETVGIFQYESAGMQKYMRDLKPTVFADLIAMNALYRPGPLEYIPSFIRRKLGEEPIEYDIPASEEYLKETYGITVYQEQVMLLSQKLAGFTKGEADTLRKAMGKKQKDVLDKMKPQFIQQASEKGHPVDRLEKVWKDWEAFASYAFNKSHSTCYAWVAYQTAYLKAHYPAEYMASVLTNNMNDIKQVSFFMEECKRMGVPVLGPDVNESDYKFTVNQAGAIRFGLGAIKGLGTGPVDSIINERQEEPYRSIFDFAQKVNLRQCTKKAFESLAYAGAFDAFGNANRAQLFAETNGRTFIETLIKYGQAYQENLNSSQGSLFGEASGVEIPEPEAPKCEDWPSLFKLNREKEVVGIFISGHPLDDYKLELSSFCNGTVDMLNDMEKNVGRELTIGCILSEVEHRKTVNNIPFGTLVIEDYSGAHKMFLWREAYLKYTHFFQPNVFIAIKGKIEIPPRRSNLEFVVRSIELLEDLKENNTNMLKLKLPARKVEQLLISELDKVLLKHEGSCPITFVISDPLENIEVVMPSKKLRVDVNGNLIKALDELGVEYELK